MSVYSYGGFRTGWNGISNWLINNGYISETSKDHEKLVKGAIVCFLKHKRIKLQYRRGKSNRGNPFIAFDDDKNAQSVQDNWVEFKQYIVNTWELTPAKK